LSVTEVTVVAVGASSAERARKLAEHWSLPMYGTYADIISERSVDAVYIALINSQHYVWAAAALRAGKHVLCEKPLANNEAQARELERLARRHNRVLLEGYHNLHHPLATRMRELVRGGELGRLTRLEVSAGLPAPGLVVPRMLRNAGLARTPPLDERVVSAKMNFSLGGGRFLSQGCYAISLARFLTGGALLGVESARMEEDVPGSRADVSTTAQLLFSHDRDAARAPVDAAAASAARGKNKQQRERTRDQRAGGGALENVVVAVEHTSMRRGFDVTAIFTNGSFVAVNFLFPFLYHHLRVTLPDGMERFEQHYETRAASASAESGCEGLRARHSWGAMLGPVYSCAPAKDALAQSAAAESSFALQLRAFAVAVRDAEERQRAGSLRVRLQRDTACAAGSPGLAIARAALSDVGASSAVANMAAIDEVYEVAGLGKRPGVVQE
jgi:predicted dehydrogenase